MAHGPDGYQDCPACGRPAPPGNHCVRCGSELGQARRGFGANPKERAGYPYIVSTLFPALPQADMRAFRIVLAGGAAITAGLAIAGLFPLALTSAALLVPILTALYLWDVDVYEDQPWRVVGMTLGIGAAAGVVLGLVSELVLEGAEENLVVSGVALPLAAFALALAGPVVLLLPRATFNDILDGATFGAVSAAALTAAVALARGASLLGGGLRPEGDEGEWLLRLVGLGVGAPVLAMCCAGGAAAALWAQWRAPLDDRSALGPLSRPLVAVPLAAALMVAGAVTQVLLSGEVWLVVLVVLDVVGLLWLRRVIGEGLRQQAGEREPGPPAVCRECGVATPEHAYCGNCGVARSALPKGERESSLRRLVLVPAVVVAGGIGLAAAGAAVAEPGELAPPCLRGELCGSPPSPPEPLVRETEVPGEGWVGAYDPELFSLEGSDASGFDLTALSANLAVRVRVAQGSEGVVAEALTGERDRLASEVLGLVDDPDPEHRVAGAMIGYVPADVLVLSATVDTPQGPGDGFTAVVLGASDGSLVTTVTITATGRNDDRRRAVMGIADVVLQGFRWTTPTGHAARTSRIGSHRTQIGTFVDATLVLRPRRAVEVGARPLSAAEIGERFGPSERALRALRRSLRAAGLKPGSVPPQRTVMHVRGPQQAIERAFGVRLLRAAGGHRPSNPARVPRAMRPVVRAVTGLDTRPIARPAAFPAGGLRPFDARKVYDIDERFTGQGETIAVLSLDSFKDTDVAEYDRITGTDSGPVERVPVAGGTRLGPDAAEVNLDLDVIRGLVPRARLLNYETSNHGGAFGDVVDAVVSDGRAKILSISWGRCELTLPAAERARDDAAFAAAAAAGVTVLVASGDSGAYECERFDSADQRLSVSWPAASQHVISVGGTTLRVTDDRARESEAGWESPLSNAGAGGGVASAEPQAQWQSESRVPGVDNDASTGMRQVPDVAAAADFRTGWLAVVDGRPRAFGGTSAAAPFWAAVVAVTRQALRESRREPPASFAQLLYTLAETPGNGAFHDVVTGGNRFYDAGPGWDYVTGLGTPNVRELLSAAK